MFTEVLTSSILRILWFCTLYSLKNCYFLVYKRILREYIVCKSIFSVTLRLGDIYIKELFNFNVKNWFYIESMKSIDTSVAERIV